MIKCYLGGKKVLWTIKSLTQHCIFIIKAVNLLFKREVWSHKLIKIQMQRSFLMYSLVNFLRSIKLALGLKMITASTFNLKKSLPEKILCAWGIYQEKYISSNSIFKIKINTLFNYKCAMQFLFKLLSQLFDL